MHGLWELQAYFWAFLQQYRRTSNESIFTPIRPKQKIITLKENAQNYRAGIYREAKISSVYASSFSPAYLIIFIPKCFSSSEGKRWKGLCSS